ncbi:hypothetical protein GCM10011414_11550 [Croceivirga lutea]|uniref:tetratricopeptide repeat-containing sensor histidine kinase n=1 Tax=Croceivirga lutea TaxID=1775167 RepID=UPI00163A38F6|nr:HAMP domain-containing sensor histidine kinase [Croceivirga lutea]GGG43603.1 hypothetical protein GCM10011414_11550 [Croceivirga lutea]
MRVSIVISTFLTLLILALPEDVISQQNKKDSLLTLYQDSETFEGFPVKQRIDILNNIASLYIFRNPDSIKFYADEAIKLNRNKTYLDGYINSLIKQADYYIEKGNQTQVDKLYKTADSLITQPEQFKVKIDLLKAKAINSYFEGRLNNMLRNTYEAIELSQQNKLIKDEAILRQNLGFLYSNYRLFDEAEAEYIIADSIWNLLQENTRRVSALSNMSLNSLRAQKYEDFIKYNDLGIKILNPKIDPLWAFRIYRARAEYYLTKQSYSKATSWMKKADSIIGGLVNRRENLEVYLLKSKIALAKKDYDEALHYSTLSYTESEELKDTSKTIAALDNLKTIAVEQQQFDKALEYFDLSDNLKEIFNESEAARELKFLRAKQQFDSERALITIQNEKKLARRNQIITITLLLIIALLAILWLIKNNVKNQKKANLKLQELNSTKDKIFTIIGHDLRSPISTLQELLELYKEKEISDQEIAKITLRLKDNVDQNSYMLSNLLIWANSQMNGFTATPVKTNLLETFENVHSIFLENIEKKNIMLTQEIYSKHFVLIDSNHLKIILRNLLSNAIKFTNKNGRIYLKSKEEQENLSLSIEDNGIGISDAVINSLNKKETVPTKRGTLNEKGTGLGLQLCKELIELNGGQLQIENNSKVGTKITLTFVKS